jgi:ABC-type lipoprotein export system ATPase subunit
MEIKDITILGGIDKNGVPERLTEITVRQGEIVGVVGPTGSGKSQLISDIEQIARHDTSTQRTVLINGVCPDAILRSDPRKKMIAQLSQNMNFFADMAVFDFLKLHAKCRNKNEVDIQEVIALANTLTGEPIRKNDNLTILSGGQTRALMVADVAMISESPIVLIDEIENAGIRKHEALQLLSGEGKIIFVVTHDPVLALSAPKRIIMNNGGMCQLLNCSIEEQKIAHTLNLVDQEILKIRETVRNGKKVRRHQLDILNFIKEEPILEY